MNRSTIKRAVIRVGGGRGFIVKHRHVRLVITAAHCLSHLPPCMTFSNTDERTYRTLLAPLGEEPAVYAELLFADPVSDLAVLGPPDGQVLDEECAAYEALTDPRPALIVGHAAKSGPAWLLSLAGRWFTATSNYTGGGLLALDNPAQLIEAGMSGSPIVNASGEAVGVAAASAGGVGQPRLAAHLPGWLLSEFGMAQRRIAPPLKITAAQRRHITAQARRFASTGVG